VQQPSYRVICGKCEKVIPKLAAGNGGDRYDTCFADPPDNLGLGYDKYEDRLADRKYRSLFSEWLDLFVSVADTTWLSFNADHTAWVGGLVDQLCDRMEGHLEFLPCVQVFTFGQHNHHDLGNNHRPLWRLRWKGAYHNPDAIRIESWRQRHGDKRADSRGRVPGDVFYKMPDEGDVFDFPRVTGNSKQRRPWHPTQLHEDMVERCFKLSTPPGGRVLAPFGGTGTDIRVCKKLGLSCDAIEMSRHYCQKIRKENGIPTRVKALAL